MNTRAFMTHRIAQQARLVASFVLATSASALFAGGMSGCATGSSAEPVPFELVTKNTLMSSPAEQSKTEALAYQIIANAEDWSRYWVSVSDDSIPGVQFDDEFVLCVYQGAKPTGGYEIAVRELEVDGDALRVLLELRQPQPGAMLIQVVTNPYAIYRVRLPEAVRGKTKPTDLQLQFVERREESESKLQVQRLGLP